MTLTLQTLILSICSGLIYSLFSARPSPTQRIGFRDDRLKTEQRWAYFTFSWLISAFHAAFVFSFLESEDYTLLALAFFGGLPLLTLITLGYYAFLTSEPSPDDSPKDLPS